MAGIGGGGGQGPGGQNERTALAWQRTALSFAGGAVLLARLTFDRLGLLSVVFLALALPLSGWVFVVSRWRYAGLGPTRGRSPRDGTTAGALAVLVALMAGVELAALLAG